MSKYTTPDAYMYQADIYCPDCILWALSGKPEDIGHVFSVEGVLDVVAGAMKINRQDENTFDSDDFPKVVFVTDEPETCGKCGVRIR